MQGLFKFKNDLFSTNVISKYAKECKEFSHLKLTYPPVDEETSLSINLKA